MEFYRKRKKTGILAVCFFLLAGLFAGVNPQSVKAAQPETAKVQAAQAAQSGELRGLWVSVFDFEELGLSTAKESTFRTNAQKLLKDAKANGVNTVFFHVRAFDDAVFPSEKFKLSTYVKSAAAYDPLEIMVELAHKNGMELHGWMNPYRITYDYFLDPAKSTSTQRIQAAVKEVLERDVDGIHFDDYFYHAKKGYKNTAGTITLKKSGEPPKAEKAANVNRMLKAVNGTVGSRGTFGVSPQGNIDNCMGSGADVKTWMSKTGYMDYVMPQIYWTDQHSASWQPKMYSGRIKEWKALQKNNINVYVGLALYRTGFYQADDPGWSKKSTNLKSQVEILRNSGFDGFALFSAGDLYRREAQTELKNLRTLLGLPTSPAAPEVSSFHGNYNSLNIRWNAVTGASGYNVYRAASQNGEYRRIKILSGRTATSYRDTGLITGKKYYYKVKAFRTIAGQKHFSKWSDFTGHLVRISKPTPYSIANGRDITVKWNAISGASGYAVYRSYTKDGTYKLQKRLTGTARQYRQYSLTKGRTYYYKVRAWHTESGKRIYSNYSEITHKTVQ